MKRHLLAFLLLVSLAFRVGPGLCADYTPPFLTPMHAAPGNALSPDTNRFCPVPPATPLARALVPPEALALARIFNHFAWPPKGQGTVPGYSKAGVPVPQTSLAENLAGQRPYPYPLPATADQAAAGAAGAARLFADLGAALGATFSAAGSVVNATLDPSVLSTRFLYSDNATLVRGAAYAAGSCGPFMAVLANEAEHGRPALLRLGDPARGQAPVTGVVDGYDRRTPSRHLVHVVFGNEDTGQWLALNATTSPVPGLEPGCASASAIIGIRPYASSLTLLSPANSSRTPPRTPRANGPFRFTMGGGLTPSTPFTYYQVQISGPGGWQPEIYWPAASCQKGAGVCEVYFKGSDKQTIGVHRWRARGIVWTPADPRVQPGPWTDWRTFNATAPEKIRPLPPSMPR
jgi:hypothetical protein